jgi:hypothetical protein
MAPRWLRRAGPFAPAAGALFLAVVLAGAGTTTSTLACDRAAGRCTWARSSWHGGGAQSFPIEIVREIRFLDELGKNGRYAETVMIFASGHEMHLAHDTEAEARRRHDIIAAFFAGQGTSLRDHEDAERWLLIAAIAAAIAAVVLAIRAAGQRVPGTAPVTGTPPVTPLLRRPHVRLILAFLAAGGVAQIILMIVASRTQGTLDLECRTRCRFQGGECLPGGSLRSTLDPGDYTIEVWTASGAERWQPRTFTIARGETTRFVCE